tara:strand:+ start:205 stop:480 length:276 start_codon:yes stop_codon:yes gene_type:complete
MKYNNHIDSINRLFLPRPSKEANKRFDMAERTFNFPAEYFNKFMNKYGLAFKSGYAETGTPVMVPGDDRKTWIRLSVGPDIDKMDFIGDIL